MEFEISKRDGGCGEDGFFDAKDGWDVRDGKWLFEVMEEKRASVCSFSWALLRAANAPAFLLGLLSVALLGLFLALARRFGFPRRERKRVESIEGWSISFGAVAVG